MRHRVSNCPQSIRPKLRVIKVERQIVQHQVQGGCRVFQVMHKKGGHRLKCLHFPALQQFLRQLGVQEAGCDLIRDALQQIKLLPGKTDPTDSIAQNHHPQQLTPAHHRHTNAIPAGAKFVGMTPLQHRRPILLSGVEIDGFRVFFQCPDHLHEILSRWLELVAPGLGQKSRVGKQQSFLLFIHQPERNR